MLFRSLEKIIYRAVKENEGVAESEIQEKQSWMQVKKMVADRKRSKGGLQGKQCSPRT